MIQRIARKRDRIVTSASLLAAALCLAASQQLHGQAAAPAPASTAPADDEEVLELSPFEVTSEGETGYTATTTLAGTRVRTDLRDIASSLSVVTPQFLKDTGATSNETLLPYQTNTEVGGLFGNFSGVGNVQGASENGKLARPNTNTRVRGLDEADNTRDYFITDIPWDSYAVDRVDLQRGPNSILFGVGSPAGIINVTTIGARLDKSSGKAEATFGSYGSQRFNLDYNQLLIKNKLALRIAAVDDNAKYKQEPAFQHDQRLFGALRYSEQLLSEKFADKLLVRVSGEYGKITSNRPRTLPPLDHVTAFFDSAIFPRVNGKIKLYDPYYSWSYAQQLDRGTKSIPANYKSDPDYKAMPGLGNDMGVSGAGPIAIYDNGSGMPKTFQSEGPSTLFGIGTNGQIDKSIGGFPFGRMQEVAGLFEYSKNVNALDATKFPSAAKGFYKDLSITDPTIFDFYTKLIDGNNKREWSDWKSLNTAISQNFFGNRLGFEFVYDYQDVTVGSVSRLGWQPTINIDVNAYTQESVRAYTPKGPDLLALESTGVGGTPNPNAGRAYVAGSGGGNTRQTQREDIRITAYGELRGADLFEKDSFFARLFNRSVVSGLYSKDKVDTFDKNWVTERTDINWANRLGAPAGINEYARRVPWIVYLSGDLTGRTTASGMNLDRINTVISPYGQMQGRYFDSHWKYSLNPSDPGYVDPAAVWNQAINQTASTQSENPANYVGWSTVGVNILNADRGDIDQLYLDASKRRDELTSKGLTLQSYIWDDMLIPTIGWRKDRISTYGTAGARDPVTQVADINFANVNTGANISEGETTTWGVVARLPKNLRRKLPWGSDISVFYNNSENFRAVNRVGFDAKPLPNPKGKSKDYGFVLSTLEDRLALKVTWYKTEVTDVDIPGGNALGSNVWFLGNMQAWGVASVQIIKAGRRGEAAGLNWYWNYALVDENKWGDAVWENPNSPEVINHPAMVKQAAAVTNWIATMPDQTYFNAYGYPVDVAKVKSANWEDNKKAISNGAWDMYSGVGSIQAAGGGRVNGLNPIGTIDQESKGMEFEFSAQPMRNWDLVLNVSKTDASRGDLGASFANWIETQNTRLKGAAGDLRLWWGGDQSYRAYYDQFIYQAYLFQKDAKGQLAPEIRPWRYNAVSNYRFEKGFLKGVNIGGGYRWQDDVILGYRLDSTKSKLDVNNPIKGASETALDAWVGYERNLNSKIKWRIQLNLRNIGDDAHLIPVSANPDGKMAQMRIVDGMAWSVRNTFEF